METSAASKMRLSRRTKTIVLVVLVIVALWLVSYTLFNVGGASDDLKIGPVTTQN